MSRHLLVKFAVILGFAVMAACSSGSPANSTQGNASVAPVELEIVNAPRSTAPDAYNELLDPEFGCSGGGSLEYGVVQRPKKN